MDLTFISTFRCNSRCQMCFIWKNPTEPGEEIGPATLERLPGGFDNVNVSGGEPTLRKDLAEIIDVLHPKGRIIEISSNGLHAERIVPIIKRHPNVKVRFSLEGPEEVNNRIRGERDGFVRKTNGLRALREAGGTDLGFAIVIQDENVEHVSRMYEMCHREGFELATSALHNAWQFYKNDNYFYDRLKVAREVENLVTAMLRSWRVKDWFRAYLNLGLLEKILGHDRLIPCVAGSKFAFIDPWGDVWACNVRTDLPLGNLTKQSWSEILDSDLYASTCGKVRRCEQNCWMVTTARTAMRAPLVPQLPRPKVAMWVALNRIRSLFGRRVPFEKYIDYDRVAPSPQVPRTSNLDTSEKGKLVRGRATPTQRYPLRVFQNR